MKTFVAFSLTLAALGLGACSERTEDATANAANSFAADASATTRNAVDDVDAATDRALGHAENAIDHAGDRAGPALDRAGDRIDNGVDRASKATGAALKDAGNALER